MKRKLFNVALFGAVLLAAPVSTFVSCADYDNDIQALDKQIASLKDLVDQKEAAIKSQIAALEAQDKALIAADEKLQNQLDECRKNCGDKFVDVYAKLEKCQGDCKAKHEYLEGLINGLNDRLNEAQQIVAEGLAGLLAKDAELTKAVEQANAAITALQEWQTQAQGQIEDLEGDVDELQTSVDNLYDSLGLTQEDVMHLTEAVREYAVAINDLNTALEDVKDELAAQKDLLEGKIDELAGEYRTYVEQTNASILKNAQDITAANEAIEAQKTALEGQIEAAKNELQGSIANVDRELAKEIAEGLDAVYESLSFTQADVMNLSEGLRDLETQLNALDAQVTKNTKLALDNALRILELEQDMLDANAQLVALNAALEGFKAAQEMVDLAQNAALTQAIANAAAEVDRKLENQKTAIENLINEKYNEAVAMAVRLVNEAQAQAEISHNQLSDMATTAQELARAAQKTIDDYKNAQATTNADFEDRIAAMEDELEAARTAFEGATLQDALKNIETAYKNADTALKSELNNTIATEVEKLNNTIAEYASALSAEIKSIVLVPEYMYNGIQAVEAPHYSFHPWTKVGDTYVRAEEAYKYCPEVHATFHMNPTNTSASTDVKDYAVVDLNVKTRAYTDNNGLGAYVKGITKDGAQNIDVEFGLGNANNLKNVQDAEDVVTMVALQYTDPNAKNQGNVVTSNYFALYYTPKDEVIIKDGLDELGVDKYKEMTIAYNAEEPVVLSKDFKVAFGSDEPSATLPEGFSYEFELIDGTDTEYFTFDPVTGAVKPQLSDGRPATVVTIGKSVNVRVLVKVKDQVAAVGYYKVTIVGEAVVETADGVVKTNTLPVVGCNNMASKVFEETYSLENIWTKAAEITGLDVATLKATYFVTMNSNDKVQQFQTYSTQNEMYKSNTYYQTFGGYGEITYVNQDAVTWKLKASDVKDEMYNPLNKKTPSVTTYIRFRSKDAVTKDTYNEFYMPLSWTPAKVEEWGEYQPVKWNYTTTGKLWKNGEVVLYPDLSAQGDAPYTYDLANAFVGGVDGFSFELINKGDFEMYGEELNNALTWYDDFRFVFAEPEGGYSYEILESSIYKLEVRGAELWAVELNHNAADVLVATIGKTGLITLHNGSIVQQIINQYAKDDAFYLHVGYEVHTCLPDLHPVKVTNGFFNVRFVRPLEVVNTPIEAQDAKGEGGLYKINFLNNVVAFTGETLAERPDLIKALGVKFEIQGAPATWKSNFTGAEKDEPLPDYIAELFTVKKGIELQDGELEYVQYRNSTAVVGDYYVIIPVKVKSTWNTAGTVVEIKVNMDRTAGLSSRK